MFTSAFEAASDYQMITWCVLPHVHANEAKVRRAADLSINVSRLRNSLLTRLEGARSLHWDFSNVRVCERVMDSQVSFSADLHALLPLILRPNPFVVLTLLCEVA